MAKSYVDIIAQMTAAVKGIREAVLGREVREHIAVAMENVLEVGQQSIDAVSSAEESANAASTSAANAAASESNTRQYMDELLRLGLTVFDGKICMIPDNETKEANNGIQS